ncbi:hypothetical protein ACSU64_05620 [Bacillaceae bacterium C204]
MLNTDLQRNLNLVKEKQQEDRQWKEDVLAVLKSINEKLGELLEGK